MQEELPPSQPSRNEFIALLWKRANDESLAYHPSTLRYFQLLAKYMGWDKPQIDDRPIKLTFTLGEDIN
jgi:hypothetical protein